MSQRSQVSRVTLQCCELSDCQWCPTKQGTNQGTRSPIELFWTAKKGKVGWEVVKRTCVVQRVQKPEAPETRKHQRGPRQTTFCISQHHLRHLQKLLNKFQKILILTYFDVNLLDLFNIFTPGQIQQCRLVILGNSMLVDMQLVDLDNKIVEVIFCYCAQSVQMLVGIPA